MGVVFVFAGGGVFFFLFFFRYNPYVSLSNQSKFGNYC